MIALLKIMGSRRQLVTVIAVASFFFVFLGMRIPYIKGDFHKSKQRPRAVVENVIRLRQEVCQHTAKQCHTHVAADPHGGMAVVLDDSRNMPSVTEQSFLYAFIAKRLSPRAPPLQFV